MGGRVPPICILESAIHVVFLCFRRCQSGPAFAVRI
ncbi:hypothetical protein PHO31112_04273 [Pandoraea horticolens]|uniref:Uncharacterized protein n=1 Tax=Pandoraea horticolens TaxID=2508298 RepID=A0A5E4Y407_9BURK|nr:hypothetical protein PHO31112_04273 [Pandoraea horticolens]